MEATLVIMAAGFGARYGGNKQVEGFGPCGEYLMEYSIYDAARAGFDRIVVVIRRDILDLVSGVLAEAAAALSAREGRRVEIVYAFQELDSLPAGFAPPAGRTKPYGTVHAVLCARRACPGPFAVINADDYYGAGTLRLLRAGLEELSVGQGLMAAFRLGKTVARGGAVTRGLCTLAGQRLAGIRETRGVRRQGEDILSGDGERLDPEGAVSMNVWGFRPEIWDRMQDYFLAFLRSERGREQTSECILPDMVDSLIAAGELEVLALPTREPWFGVTHREDAAETRAQLARLCREGVYPSPLWA